MKKLKLHQDVWIGLVCLILTAWFLYLNRDLSFESALMPRILCGLMGILAAAITVSGIRKSRNADPAGLKQYLNLDVVKMPLIAWLFVFGYVILFLLCGYFAATAVMLPVYMRFMKRSSWKVIMAIDVVYLALVYIFFVKQFGLNLWNFGLLGEMLF